MQNRTQKIRNKVKKEIGEMSQRATGMPIETISEVNPLPSHIAEAIDDIHDVLKKHKVTREEMMGIFAAISMADTLIRKAINEVNLEN